MKSQSVLHSDNTIISVLTAVPQGSHTGCLTPDVAALGDQSSAIQGMVPQEKPNLLNFDVGFLQSYEKKIIICCCISYLV